MGSLLERGPQRRFTVALLVLLSVLATNGSVAAAGSPPPGSQPATGPGLRSANVLSFYVSAGGDDGNAGDFANPFRTLERARTAVRANNANMTGDILVYLRDGRYELPSTFVLSPPDSGTGGFRVRYLAYPGESPALSGGRLVTGWSPVAAGVWKATPPHLDFRQLYVDGEPATRARTPNSREFHRLTSWDEGGKRLVVPSSVVASWARLDQVEMHVQKHWTGDVFRIESIAFGGGNAYIAPLQPERDRSFLMDCGAQRQAGQAFHFENAYEFLDAPGEWYLNRTTSELFYRPRPGERMDQAVVTIPGLERLVGVAGTPDDPVHHVSFEGLAFEGSNWVFPSSEGFVGLQATVHVTQAGSCATLSVDIMPSAFHVTGAHNLTFSYNRFRGLGGSGLALHEAASDIAIVANVFEDIAGNAVGVGTILQSNPADPRLVCARNTVSDNYVTTAGRWYPGGVGIFAGYVRAAAIEHNEVARLPYTGISVGWGWTSGDTALRDNLVRYNNIHGVLAELDDGGGIYTLSKQPGTLIAENFIHDLVRSPYAGAWPIAGVYLDQGSSFITVRDNSMVEVPIVVHENVASDNTLINNGNVIESVIDAAGIRPQYRWIRPAPDPARADPAAHWPADDDRYVGNELRSADSGAHDGVSVGATKTGGIIGSAVAFDGADDRVRVIDEPRLESENFTLTAWFKVAAFKTAGDTRDWLVNKNYHEWWDGHYALVVNGGAQPQLGAYMNIGGGSGAVRQAWSAPWSIGAGQWHLAAATYNGSTLALYLDGTRVSSTWVGLPRTSGYGDMYLGRRADSYSYFSGALDDVRFYDRALGDAEVASLYRRIPDPPVALSANGTTVSIELAWNAPAYTGGFPVAAYRIYRGAQPGIYTWDSLVGDVTWYNDTGVADGQTYYYVVAAINPVGEGPSSAEVTAMRSPTVPETSAAWHWPLVVLIAVLFLAGRRGMTEVARRPSQPRARSNASE